MLMTQLTVTKYRYYRWLLAGAVGLAILLLSLYTRYYQEIGTIEHNRQVLPIAPSPRSTTCCHRLNYRPNAPCPC